MESNTISVVVVNHNTSSLLEKCLSSILTSVEKRYIEVIVVDNASTDGSVEMLQREFPQVKLIQNKTNVGFGMANNQGAKGAKGEWLLFLNSDTEMLPETMEKVSEIIKNDECRMKNEETDTQHSVPNTVFGIQLLNQDGSIQPSAGYFPTLPRVALQMLFLDDLPFVKRFYKPYQQNDIHFYETQETGNKKQKTKEPKNPRTQEQKNYQPYTSSCIPVDWVTGAFLLVPKWLFEKVGGFDESIFMYGEEVDLCYRLKQAGARIYYTPEAQIYHLKGASSEDGFKAAVIGEYKGLLTFYQKHWPNQLIPLKLSLMTGALFRILLFGMISPRKASVYWEALKIISNLPN